MDEWVVWFYIGPFTLHLNRDRADIYCPHCSVEVPVPVLVPDTASVIIPLGRFVNLVDTGISWAHPVLVCQ